jgi:hypothetical protein
MPPTTVVLIAGTWGGSEDWTNPQSLFSQFLRSKGFDPLQFVWSGDVNGVPDPLENGKFSDWKAGGWSLSYFLRSLPYDQRNLIDHSHGGQLPPFCAVETRTLLRNNISVCTPVRKDLRDTYIESRKFMNRWRHVYAKGWDFWQRAGEFLDGQVGWTRQMPPGSADDNVAIPGIDHHLLLTDPKNFPLWIENGLLDVLRTPAIGQGV